MGPESETRMHEVMRVVEFDAGHRLLRHEAKCAHVHGHRYKAEIYCRSLKLDTVGRVVDFGVIKEVVGGWIDTNWDHAFIVDKADMTMREFLVTEDQKHYVLDQSPTAE